MLNTAATGEDDLLNIKSNKEMNDLKYRKKQLEQLQTQVIDLEDVNGAISITDMTFNDFKADLQNALKEHEKLLNEAPLGMYAITDTTNFPEAEPGVILTLRQQTNDLGQENSILPYIVEISKCYNHQSKSTKNANLSTYEKCGGQAILTRFHPKHLYVGKSEN